MRRPWSKNSIQPAPSSVWSGPQSRPVISLRRRPPANPISRMARSRRPRRDYAAAFNNRGVARRDKGDLDGALQDYTEAIRLKPDHANAFNNRGLGRRDKGDLDGALQDYTEAIRLKPDYANAFNNRSLARRDKGDLDGALQDCTEAIGLKPDDDNAFYNRGNARRDKGDLDGALQSRTASFNSTKEKKRLLRSLPSMKRETMPTAASTLVLSRGRRMRAGSTTKP
jgi:tetratricopeptide (TPR) repeat protein